MSNTGCSVEHTEPYALRVIGDSMTPEFEDGHIIIVDPGHPLYKDAFVVIEQDGEVFFGQYKNGSDLEVKTGDKLQHLNPKFPAIPLVQDCILKGVVIQRSTGRRKNLKHYHAPTTQH